VTTPWRKAAEIAENTPESRNRWIDFLRMISIISVVIGHWMMAAPSIDNGQPVLSHMLDIVPWSQWLTWLMQVMPVFFFVGGYSNGISWDSARRKEQGFAHWLAGRLGRLLGPVTPLLIVWSILGALAHFRNIDPDLIKAGSRIALVPVWFLAVYILVVLLVPFSRAFWLKWGWWSIFVPVTAAAILDWAFFSLDQHALAWLNYLFVWFAVHQLGYAWLDGRIDRRGKALLIAAGGLGALLALTQLGPYPLSLVGVPSDEISNTLPPKLPLLALAAAQFGILLALEKPARRLLARRFPWTLTVLINGMIMSIFLWHSTVMVLVIGGAFLVCPGTLHLQPGLATWWLQRPLWIGVFILIGTPVVLFFSRFERSSAGKDRRPTLGRLLPGCLLACLGLAFLANNGVGDPQALAGLAWGPLIAVFAGIALL